jgi:hypothetical protein
VIGSSCWIIWATIYGPNISTVGNGGEGTGCDEDNAAHVLLVCKVLGNLQQQPWQAGVAAQVDCILDGALQGPSLDFQGENLRSSLHWLYLAWPC